MKTAFKKLTLLIFHRDRKNTTELLQRLGVLHIDENDQARSDDIETLEHKKSNLKKAIEAISDHAHQQTNAEKKSNDSIQSITKRALDLKHKIEGNIQTRESLRKDKLQRVPWGDNDITKLQQLAKYGFDVRYCAASKKDYKKFDFDSLTHQVIYESSDLIYFAVIGRGQLSLPFESVKVPETTLSEIVSHEKEIEIENRKIRGEFSELLPHLPEIKRELTKVNDDLKFALTEESYRKFGEGSILSLSGWFPERMEEKLVKYLEKEKLSYSIEEPKPENKVPVLLKNKKYSKLFEPITKIFELPNYYELDLTPLIAVFYPIMFAYCLGDAGYGLVFLTVAIVGWFSFLKNERRLAVLGIVLGVFTTIMGIVKSGSVFGIPTTVNDSLILFQYLRQYVIIPDDRNLVFNAFNVSLMIGVVQIFTGIIIAIVNKLRYEGFVQALPQLGKMLIVSGLIWSFLADMQKVEILQPFPLMRMIMLIFGVFLVLIFHDMSQPILTRAASGLLPLFFIVTGILGDILSYVRLFALGVASSVLGLVVNQIGMQIMGDSWWGIIIGVLFLIVGHTLNFFIAILGAFVHPLRLTFVEFYNNAQFQGGGKVYQPFRKEILDMNN